MHSRSDVFGENIVQALTSGKQNFLPGNLLTGTDIHVENIDFANHKQNLLKKTCLDSLKDTLSYYGCAYAL